MPINVAATVSINGALMVGETLTSVITDANGVPSNVTYQWLADGVEVGTSSSYTLAESDKTKVMSLRVTFTDNDGYAELATSAASEVVQPVLPEIDLEPSAPFVPPPPNGSITSNSGWYLKNHSISGDKVYLDALKQTSLGGLKSSVVAAASVADLMQHLLSDGSIDALDYAVNGLLGAGVKWTLDKENQRISYTAIL